ncbi:peroxide stress protein YaaA [Aromatoleum buckelii]|uniref:UPF0246 protein GO608_16515 n=1 Tax=Aromatoleum buckelii TaxID=200254 RepID=A0ABX1N6M2_9RHOO|nr:peroxide stress protein YaaA [Aromatoleum buckelii]MCK0512765.1 peroxide stress protein YaaA [Aromatoleum buckelii]
MIFVISPAKALDFETPPVTAAASQPDYLREAEELIGILRQKTPAEVAELMHLSDPLAALNVARFESWHRPFTRDNAKQALLAFNGDVYGGLDAPTLSEDDFAWAQQHLRILSGLYGMLRPLDLMQPYRLEMGTRLGNPRGANLYAYWGDTLAEALNRLLAAERDTGGSAVLVNLASQEYFKAAARAKLAAQVITPVFEDWKGGRYRIITFYAKRARGLMSRYAIRNRVEDVEGLKGFDAEGYGFAPEVSDADTLVFRRRTD